MKNTSLFAQRQLFLQLFLVCIVINSCVTTSFAGKHGFEAIPQISQTPHQTPTSTSITAAAVFISAAPRVVPQTPLSTPSYNHNAWMQKGREALGEQNVPKVAPKTSQSTRTKSNKEEDQPYVLIFQMDDI